MIDRIQTWVFRAPTPAPVATSFGVMRDRPAVFVKLTDRDGGWGWGEIFANWPAAGAEHRARLLHEDMADLVLDHPAEDLFARLTAATRIRAIQCGEQGPFAQVIAGLDTAAADMAARRAGLPLARHLSGMAAPSVPAYASGIAVARAAEILPGLREAGLHAAKVKVGFDPEADARHLTQAASLMQGGRLMADANQAWDVPTALRALDQADALGLTWLEEPLPADAPAADWAALTDAATPLAAGENVTGPGFARLIANGHVTYIQPDVAKWGGVTGNLEVARAALAQGRTYCPHFLGGGIGLHASAHLLAAAGGPGLLELDTNENPLRDAFGAPVEDGAWHLSDMPGLGIDRLPEEIAPFETLALDSHH
ncbi:mandelate racemase/muconate lactonizing enzyme family protein [Jannaschia seohaensis]|uniref:L-alanine-DL-glutamate epimerase n=1 Tax=Jannaschia seohaensis TaxID=475081 RepID=A0A2Y9A1C2_9RHOB|nr:enolase C-terminal domain-like protein [Jannaschia seohaensis]PWJ21797.1 L-alanine-DL-glutamate epimerase-like enolase superfamily enzyme [Jannaschia seohaensis]SSA38075.1 L-alanine-DL-glutamate epimerase [Jannaschia seohaensis]